MSSVSEDFDNLRLILVKDPEDRKSVVPITSYGRACAWFGPHEALLEKVRGSNNKTANEELRVEVRHA